MWNDLTLNEKAELIKLAVNNGITDLSTIRDTYNKYAEGGPLDGSDTSKAEVNSNAIPSELPEAVVTGYAPLRLTTHYPIVSEKYPYTGHSELAVPIDPETFYGEYNPGNHNYMHYLHIDKKSNDRDYNLITNNCADATLNFLNNAFNKNETPNLFTTPGDVRDLAIKLGGRVVKNNDGSDTVLIPRNKDNYKDISKKALDLFYSNTKSFKLHGSHSYSEGGPIKKVGPTYDETSKRWINPYGKDITGQSFDGDYGVTTYYDTGAVEFVPFGKEPVYRYASNAPRKYIGGSTIEARQKYYDVDKEFTDNVKRMADKYGISANTLASRIAKEGPIDEAINNYNNTNGYLQRGKLLGPVWGLDDLGTLIHEGTVKVNPEMELFTDVEMENEKGRTTYSVASDNYLDGVEITAAALSYYKNEMKKRFPKSSNDRLEQLATAAFNMGVSRAVELAKEGKIVNTYKPFINIKASGGPLWGNYNKYDKGGELEEEVLLPEVVITPRTSALAKRENKFGLGGIITTESNIEDAELAEAYKRFSYKVERGEMSHEEALNRARRDVERMRGWKEVEKERNEQHKKREQYIKDVQEGKVKVSEPSHFPSLDYSSSKEPSKLSNTANYIMESLQSTDMGGIADIITDSRNKYVEEKMEEWYPYKLWLESTATAAELASGAYTLGKLAHTSGIGRSSRILNNLYGWDKGQMLANSLGATADGYQLLASDNTWDTTENSLELTGDVAGIIGGTNWFRSTPFFGRYGDKIDDILDYSGYTAAGYDIIGKPIVNTIKGVVERAYPDNNDKNKKNK